ncbi:MAG: nitroreductase family protein [Nitrospinota bacterium]
MEKKCADFYEILNSRASVRTYTDKRIEDEKLDRLLETLRRSQSAANSQPWHFIVLKKDGREVFDEAVLYKEGFKSAPVIIVACQEPAAAWVRKTDKVNYAVVDVTIAVTDMVAAATAEGLGTCWIAAFDPDKVVALLQIPEGIEPVGLITLGYPEKAIGVVEKPDRKKITDIIHFGRW